MLWLPVADGAARPMLLPLTSNDAADAKQHRDWMIVPYASESLLLHSPKDAERHQTLVAEDVF